MEIIKDIINTVINNFDFAYIISINIMTYLSIKYVDKIKKKKFLLGKKELFFL